MLKMIKNDVKRIAPDVIGMIICCVFIMLLWNHVVVDVCGVGTITMVQALWIKVIAMFVTMDIKGDN